MQWEADLRATFTTPLSVVNEGACQKGLKYEAWSIDVGEPTRFSANGDLAVLYREKRTDDRDMYLVIQDRAGHLQRTRISSTSWHVNACPMTYYALTSTKDGYLAAWPTKGDVYFARIDRKGVVLPPGK